MLPRIDKISCVIFFVQLCFLSFTKAVPDNIKMRVKTANEIIELNWQQNGQYLANRNLPLWQIQRGKTPIFLPHIIDGIGDFVTYHDVEKSSAIVYFVKFNIFYGVIDSRYYFIQVPLNEINPNGYYNVDNGYIFSRKPNENKEYFHDGEENWLSNLFSDDELEFVNSIIDHSDSLTPTANYYNTPSTSVQNGQQNHQQSIQNNFAGMKPQHAFMLYPEILVFITYDIYKEFSRLRPDKGLSLLVMYYIVYFNAVNMLFAKLGTPEIGIHINIAGIAVESQVGAFPYSIAPDVKPDGTLFYRFREKRFSFSFPIYIRQHRDIFPEDSFDFYFVATSYPMYKNHVLKNGVSNSGVDIYHQRSVNLPYKRLLGSIVQRTKSFGDYITGTRQIARLMGIRGDEQSEGLYVRNLQCFAIMQESRNYCRNCLKWSDKSRHELVKFYRHNRNSCFLMNFPRSLFPHGQPLFSVNPEHQCQCYKFPVSTLNPFYISSIPVDSCDKPMKCSFHQNDQTLTPLPLDGTPCGGSAKVCWRGQCEKTYF